MPWSPVHVAVSALLALLLVALLPFPAALFNATLEANYAEVRRWFRWVPHPAARGVPTWLRFAALTVVAAVLNAFLDPHLRLDAASAQQVAGLALSIAAVALLAAVPARRAMHRRFGERPHVRLYPIGLVVAAVCVLVSRLSSFEPGYLYGVIAGLAFTGSLAPVDRGRIAFGSAALLLGVAVVAFVARVPVHAAATRGGVVAALADTVLAALFAAGVEGNLLGLLPLRFLPGEEVRAWSRVGWAVAFGLSVFAFLHALSARAGDATTRTSVVTAAVLFAAFATVSVSFWAWFRFRHPTPTSV